MKWKKIAAVTTASAMTVQLAACGTAVEEPAMDETTTTYVEEEIVEDVATETDENNSELYDENGELVDIYESDYADDCDEWYEDEDGSFVCEDESSSYYQNHFFDGVMYATVGAMVASSFYKNKNRVSGTMYKDQSTTTGGGGGYTGGSSSNTKNAGVTTTPTNPATDTSKPSNGKSSYSSGKSGFSSGGASRGGSSSS